MEINSAYRNVRDALLGFGRRARSHYQLVKQVARAVTVPRMSRKSTEPAGEPAGELVQGSSAHTSRLAPVLPRVGFRKTLAGITTRAEQDNYRRLARHPTYCRQCGERITYGRNNAGHVIASHACPAPMVF